MPFSIKIDEDAGCAFIKWSGVFSASENRGYVDATRNREDFQSCARRLHDARDVEFDVPSDDVRAAANNPKPAAGGRPRIRSATIVSSELGYGIMRMLGAMYRDPAIEFAVFRDYEQARAWLNLPAGYPDPFLETPNMEDGPAQ